MMKASTHISLRTNKTELKWNEHFCRSSKENVRQLDGGALKAFGSVLSLVDLFVANWVKDKLKNLKFSWIFQICCLGSKRTFFLLHEASVPQRLVSKNVHQKLQCLTFLMFYWVLLKWIWAEVRKENLFAPFFFPFFHIILWDFLLSESKKRQRCCNKLYFIYYLQDFHVPSWVSLGGCCLWHFEQFWVKDSKFLINWTWHVDNVDVEILVCIVHECHRSFVPKVLCHEWYRVWWML